MKIQNRIGKYLKRGRSWYQRPTGRIRKITVHHTASDLRGRSDDEILDHHYRGHLARGWPGLGYHYFITPNGNIYQINDLRWVTWHDSHNWDSIGIALEGYFHPPKNMRPTNEQLRALRWLLDHLCTQHPEFPADQDDVFGHRDRQATACPGDLLYPYVKEYREKRGRVSWGEAPANEDGNTITISKDDYNRFRAIERELEELYQYFDLREASKIRAFVSGLKSRITDLENKLGDVLGISVKAANGEENTVGYFLGRYVEQKSEISNLKDELIKCRGDKKRLRSELKEARQKIKKLEGLLEGRDEEWSKRLKQKEAEKKELADRILILENEKKDLRERLNAALKMRVNNLKIFDILELLAKRILGQ